MVPVLGLLGVVAAELALAGVVLARNPSRPVHRWFAAFTGAVASWGLVNGLFRLVRAAPVNLLLARGAFAAAALIAVTFFRFARVFPHAAPAGPAGRAVTAVGLLVGALAFSPAIVGGLEPDPEGYRLLYGPLHPYFGAYFVLAVGWALAHLARKLSSSRGFARAQLQYLFAGVALASLGGITTNLALPLLLGTSRFSLYGPYFTLIWMGLTAHSIVRHRLLDVRVVVSRAAAYGAAWAIAAGAVVALVLLNRTARQDPALPPTAAAATGLLVALGVGALGPRFRRLADRYLYRPGYDPRQVLREGTRAMATFADVGRVAEAMAALILRALPAESLAILAWRPEREEFTPVFVHHVDPAFRWPETAPGPGSPLTSALRHRTAALLAAEVVSGPPPTAAVAGELQAWNAELAVPVRVEGRLSGLLLLGPKLSGDPFYRDDLELLEALASQLAVGLANARLYREVVSIKEYNERILTYMDSGVVAVREDGTVTTFNPAAERLTGLPASRVLGHPAGVLDPALQRLLQESLRGHPDAATEVTVTHPDGRSQPLLVHASPLHDGHGQVRGAIAVLNDHSRLKALEEDKRRADRLAAMGALASGIAHEVRNPLVAIRTFAELLPERADDQEFRSTFAKVAVREIHRIEELLGRLRALAGPTAAELKPLDLTVPIRETLDLLAAEAERRRVRLVTDLAPDLPLVPGDGDQLKQLFLNLVLNGLEAMPEGGTLTVRAGAERDRQGAPVVTVRVTDTGCGIPPGDLGRVFDPFFTTKAQGTGLGLAICRTIADAHRAALWAESSPGTAGSTFVVQFPVAAPVALREALR